VPGFSFEKNLQVCYSIVIMSKKEKKPVINSQDFPLKVAEGITLELVKVEDAEEMFKVVDENRNHLQEWLPWVSGIKTIEDERKALEKNVQDFRDSKELNLTIRDNGNIIGRIGVHYIHWEDKRTEIGYWLAESVEGKGIMTKACKTLLDYLFGSLKLHRIEILCSTENERSFAIPERLGFTCEGTLKEFSFLNGRYVDLKVYRLLDYE
jgi:ribosomal-protein-serine acetyltransferase